MVECPYFLRFPSLFLFYVLILGLFLYFEFSSTLLCLCLRMFFSPSFASSFSSCFFVLSFFFPVLSCFLLLHVFLLYLLACLYFGVSMNHRRLYRCSATPALLYGFHGLATIASSGRRHSYGHFLSLSGPLPTPAAPATISLIRPFQPLSGRYGCSPTIPAIVCLFQPLRSLFGWRSGRSLAAPLFIVRPSPWSFVFVRSCPPAPSPCVTARPCLPAFFHLYVCCRLSSLPLFGRFFFLVICPVLSGRPLAVRPTLHPEASIGHSANYWSLFGAPFRPLVRSLVFSRLHLREFQPPPSLAISAGCRSGHSRSVVGCLAAPVVVVRLLYGRRHYLAAAPYGPSDWLAIPAAPAVFRPFLPLFGSCPATPTVVVSDGSASSASSFIFWSIPSSCPVHWLSLFLHLRSLLSIFVGSFVRLSLCIWV